nr:SNF2-related protein [uncultured Mitsuokella sp.]
MINKNTLRIENHRLLMELQAGNKRRYMDFLATMAKYHKYGVQEQMSLFFHAPASAEAVATAPIWASLKHPIRRDAEGIPILTGRDGESTLAYVYDVGDTTEWKGNRNVTWKLDQDAHKAYLDQAFPVIAEQGELSARVLAKCRSMAEASQAQDKELVALSTAYVVLSRMGEDAEEALGIELLMHETSEADGIHAVAEELQILEDTNALAKSILNPMGQYVHQKERERNERREKDSVLRGMGADKGALPESGEARVLEGTRGDGRGGELSEGVRGGLPEDGRTDGREDAGTRGNHEPAEGDGMVRVGDTDDGRPRAGEGNHAGGDPVVTESTQENTERAGEDEAEADGSNAYDMSSSVRRWYRENFPEDSLGEELVERTFSETLEALESGNDLYAFLGIGASDMREAIFSELSTLSGHPYDAIYALWQQVQETATQEERGGNAASIDAEGHEGVNVHDEHPEQPAIDLSAIDYSADLSTVSGKRKVFLRNLAAIKTLKTIERGEREATPDEVTLLKSYAGFGGLAEAFNELDPAWQNEYHALRETLTDAEYRQARASVLNAHFTDARLIEQIYGIVQKVGFDEGHILEPSAGSGRFFESMPAAMREGSNLFGVELDSLTSRITAKLYPDVTMSNQGFETTTYAPGSFDMAISNVPYGNYRVTSDVTHRADGFLIHDYFLAKMLDEVRPGGLVVAVTSRGTMDKEDRKLREYMADRADLVTAVRLPNDAFKSAGAEVNADILVFRKHDANRAKDEFYLDWVFSDAHKQDGAMVHSNRYWEEHPEHCLAVPKIKSTAYGPDLVYVPQEGKDLYEALQHFTDHVLAKDMEQENFPRYTEAEEPLPIPVQESMTRERPYGVFCENGKLIFRGAFFEAEALTLTPKQEQLLRSAVHVREALYGVLEAQKNGCSDVELVAIQKPLNALYEEHVKRFGRICTDRTLKACFEKDPGYPLLRSLEIYDGKTFQRKADIFSKRTVFSDETPTHVDTAEDALKLSLHTKGEVDLAYMSSLTGDTRETLIKQLEFTSIFYDPEKQEYVLAEEYLSGDVRQKIEDIEKAIDGWRAERDSEACSTLYPSIKPIACQNPTAQEQKLLSLIPFGSRMDSYRFSSQEMRDLKQAADGDWERALLLSSRLRDGIRLVAKEYRNSLAFLLDALRHGSIMRSYDVMTEAYEALRQVFDRLDVASETRIQMIEGDFDTTEAIRVYDFLQQHIDTIPIGDYEDDAYYAALNAKWSAYRTQKDAERDILYQTAGNPQIQRLTQRIEDAQKNLAALEEVKPADLRKDEIRAMLGSVWIEPRYIHQFLREELSLTYSEDAQIKVRYSDVTAKWRIEGKGITGNAKVDSTYGTEHINALNLCELALNLKTPKIYRTVLMDGAEKKVIDQELTIQAQAKQDALKDAFETWIWKDEKRAQELVRYYNRHFNNIRSREYNGEHLTFPGMATGIVLKPHQKNAIAHTLYGGNTLLAHCVGAGKTFEMAASCMESKRLGLASKPMIVVPKHLTEQTGEEFQRLYPGARMLVATSKDFDAQHRKEFCTRIATQNWDAVILSYSQFERIPLSKERQEAIVREQIHDLIEAIGEAKQTDGEPFGIKEMERKRKELEAKLEKLHNEDRKDDTVTFEELGIDRLYVDEAHYYKNLYTPTKLTRLPGVSTTDAQKTTDLYEKCMYLHEITGGKGIVFATGTPISNSITEMFTLQRYLQPDRLKKQGLAHFDSWAAMFGKTETATEITPDGNGFRERMRFAKFCNVPELKSMFAEIADVKTPDMLNLDVPEAELVMERVDASAYQKDYIKELGERSDDIRNGSVSPSEDNMLRITSEGHALALDERLIDPTRPDYPGSKVNRCIRNVWEIYQQTQEDRSTQIIFCDQSTPRTDGRFSVYNDIRQKLMDKGVKPEEIAFIHDAKTDKAKDKLFKDVNEGKVRVLLGSTDKLGVGTNVQKRLIATHDLDVPWRPSDLEQRKGRIVRQGNTNKKVKIFRYISQGTFDAYMWQMIENKQRYISQIMTSKQVGRETEDCDDLVLTAAEAKALATGNPLLREKITLDTEIKKLEVEHKAYLEAQSNLQKQIRSIYPTQIAACKEQIAKTEDTKMVVDNHTMRDVQGNELFSIVLNGKTYHDPKEAATVIREVAKEDISKLRGEYKGLRLSAIISRDTYTPTLVVLHKISRNIPIAETGTTTIRRLDETLKNLANNIAAQKQDLHNLEHGMKVAKEELSRPFKKEALLAEKRERAKELDKQIAESVGKSENQREENEPQQEIPYETRVKNILSYVNENGWPAWDRLPSEPSDRFFILHAVKPLQTIKREGAVWGEKQDSRLIRAMCEKGYSIEKIAHTIETQSPSLSGYADALKTAEYMQRHIEKQAGKRI